MHATSSVTVDLASNTSPTAESRVTTTDDSSCGYSQLGPSASVVDAESELGRIKALLDRIVKAEVSEWLNKVVEDVVANACLTGVKRRRISFKPKEKVHLMDAMRNIEKEAGNPTSKTAVQQKLQAATGTKVRVQMLEKWQVQGAKQKRGRKINYEFEREILDQLVFTTLEKVENQEQASSCCSKHLLQPCPHSPSCKDSARFSQVEG